VNSWIANSAGIAFAVAVLLVASLALLWRVGSWHVSDAASLTLDRGLTKGSRAPNLVGWSQSSQVDVSWGGRLTLVVFGLAGCRPCEQLLESATNHPATRHMRKVYISNRIDEGDPNAATWELYRFDDEPHARRLWDAPISPYFYVIDPDGRIADKGIANAFDHLDRLLAILPPGVSPYASALDLDGREVL